MAGERVRLEVQQRDALGSRDSRRARRAGLIPGVLYGRGKKPHPFVVPERALRSALGGAHGLHAILDVVVDDQKTTHASVVKDYQRDPIRGHLTHIDLHEVKLDQPITAQVTVELVGESPGVKGGGVLTQLVREVTVEALPLEMPDKLSLDIGRTEIGDALRVSDLALPHEITVLDDPENVLVTVSAPRLAAELEALEAEAAAAAEAELEEAEEGEEVEAAEEGEPGAEAVAEGEAPEGEQQSEPSEG
ncbi:MAG TPA: 50S ribosomal protein L25 [Gaiellaceae bacterium]|nr:50S ribosomal protein L25 [Gaiellaceae bacterium]